ncbi:hypothetical protein WOLCODRAFT_147562 [Wolfiporia cocos MD-104 SS10]|uniref:Uncharacterized protein n=1 Tax=Wolfiporia cocos (strain MD-104) TaxID=742152 RepID=A0A2H3JBY8_WOLCO|nr:hypothetical protein WOLCODRAFT_147562 [Wolfiporia cocos MD-104 SS10]
MLRPLTPTSPGGPPAPALDPNELDQEMDPPSGNGSPLSSGPSSPSPAGGGQPPLPYCPGENCFVIFDPSTFPVLPRQPAKASHIIASTTLPPHLDGPLPPAGEVGEANVPGGLDAPADPGCHDPHAHANPAAAGLPGDRRTWPDRTLVFSLPLNHSHGGAPPAMHLSKPSSQTARNTPPDTSTPPPTLSGIANRAEDGREPGQHEREGGPHETNDGHPTLALLRPPHPPSRKRGHEDALQP